MTNQDLIPIKIQNLLILGRFYSFEISLPTSLCHDLILEKWYDKIKSDVESALRQSPNLEVETLLRSCAALLKISDLAKLPIDQIEEEALNLAEDQIRVELNKDGLPAPKSLRDHAKQLLLTQPDLLRKAKLRLEARYQIVTETL